MVALIINLTRFVLKCAFVPGKMNMCFLHDREPGEQRLQVVLTGEIIIESLWIIRRELKSPNRFADMMTCCPLCSYCDDLCVEFW